MPHGVEVARGRGLAAELFGGHVADGADEAHARVEGCVDGVFHGAEVDEDEASVDPTHQVLGLDVPMDDRWRQAVEVLEDREQLVERVEDLVDRRAAGLDGFGEVPAIDQVLHQDEGEVAPVARGEAVDIVRDLRVPQLAQRGRLAREDALGSRSS